MNLRQIGLILHGIGTPKRAVEHEEAPYWISRNQFVSLLDQIAARKGIQEIYLSFDDGNMSDIEIALPLLLERGLRAEFFVLAGRIGQSGSLGVSDIVSLHTAGMGIGSHGADHLDWSRLDSAALRNELQGSRQRIEDRCGLPILTAAVPFGSYSPYVIREIANAGYTHAYTSDGGKISPGKFLRPRNSIRGSMDMADMVRTLNGRMSLRRMIGSRVRMNRMRFLY